MALDRAVAAVLLLLFSPLVLVCAWRVRQDDGGPAFVAVPRIGQHGVPFRMWKLRSMRVASADGLAGGSAITSSDDDRITPVGRRLRRYRLDELPQLWNVVRGEMGLLGPRPETPEYVDVQDPRWQEVLEAPPGIAGATQVLVNEWEARCLSSGALHETYQHEILPVKLAVDGWYVRSASPAVDVRIALATLTRRSGRGSGSLLWTLVAREVPDVARIPD